MFYVCGVTVVCGVWGWAVGMPILKLGLGSEVWRWDLGVVFGARVWRRDLEVGLRAAISMRVGDGVWGRESNSHGEAPGRSSPPVLPCVLAPKASSPSHGAMCP